MTLSSIPYLLVSPEITTRKAEAEKILTENDFSLTHPDLLWFSEEEKLGIEQARKIQQFLSLKPFQGSLKTVVIIKAEDLTLDAQNALLKTLEEPPGNCLIILGVASEEQLLPTIISRCNVVHQTDAKNKGIPQKDQKEIEKLLSEDIEKRFQFIEKLENREEFLLNLVSFFRHKLQEKSSQKNIHHFLKNLVEAEKWAKQNVNIRAILEYLMLKMPKLD